MNVYQAWIENKTRPKIPCGLEKCYRERNFRMKIKSNEIKINLQMRVSDVAAEDVCDLLISSGLATSQGQLQSSPAWLNADHWNIHWV